MALNWTCWKSYMVWYSYKINTFRQVLWYSMYTRI